MRPATAYAQVSATAKPLRLPRDFYDRPTGMVARALLGKCLVHETAGGRVAGMVVETEAYVGPHDLACHASKGRTRRTEVMFGRPGHLYVYLIYGMYHCLNIVTEREGHPSAVLIRALQPVERRGQHDFTADARQLWPNGPGKLCRFLEIDRTHNGFDLTSGRIWLEDRGVKVAARQVVRTPRIGIEYAGEWKRKLLRYYVKENQWISKPRLSSARAPKPSDGRS
ncbi:MAG: DNA-3-methyladenine glycosylase [Acidobacteria bacterium]|nr:DNA-3-methyladenine glycosylase [Acidobacteriota bacterium]